MQHFGNFNLHFPFSLPHLEGYCMSSGFNVYTTEHIKKETYIVPKSFSFFITTFPFQFSTYNECIKDPFSPYCF